jgi:hypothetical protein
MSVPPTGPLARIAVCVLIGLSSRVCAAEAPRVEFEIVTSKGLSPATTQQWYQVLTDLKVAGLRIRAEAPTDTPKIDVGGTKERPSFRVTGTINARGLLVVPGGQFTTADGARIKRWIGELANNGVEGVTERKTAFSLTKTQLAEATEGLMRPITFATKGMPPIDAARKIVSSLKLPATVDDAVKRALVADDRVRDELQGISSGTALAAILRPAGAALVPEKPDGKPLRWRLIEADGAADVWPVGWPVEKQPFKVVPKLFEFLNAEIEGVSAAEAIEAIRGRLGVPFLFDHNNMVRHRIDLTKPVAVPARRTYYSKVLDEVPFKAGLKYELRADENDKPFLWITTLKR